MTTKYQVVEKNIRKSLNRKQIIEDTKKKILMLRIIGTIPLILTVYFIFVISNMLKSNDVTILFTSIFFIGVYYVACFIVNSITIAPKIDDNLHLISILSEKLSNRSYDTMTRLSKSSTYVKEYMSTLEKAELKPTQIDLIIFSQLAEIEISDTEKRQNERTR
jgi:hypothetical protein